MHPSQAPGVVGPFAGLDVPWLLAMRSEVRRDHPFLIWAPFDAPARKWSYGEFHERVGALAAGLVKRGIRQGDYFLIHLDNCIETPSPVCLCRARRDRGHDQHALGGGRDRIFRRPLRRRRRDHPAGLCRAGRNQLQGIALDRRDLA